MRKGKNVMIRTIVPDFLELLIKNYAEKRRITVSAFLGKVIIENIEKY